MDGLWVSLDGLLVENMTDQNVLVLRVGLVRMMGLLGFVLFVVGLFWVFFNRRVLFGLGLLVLTFGL